MKTMSLLFSATALFLSTAMPASAVTLLYSFAPTATGVPRFSFNVDSNPAVSGVAPFKFSTTVQNFSVNGVVQTSARTFTFNTSDTDGGFTNSRVGDLLGAQLFSGLTSAPTLLTGTFSLSRDTITSVGTLTVSTVAAIPEPATWAMMAIGLGLAGSALRRRTTTTRISYTAA